jgi:Protein of unknown function (DUF3489)
MSKLSDTHLIILANAAKHDDGSVLPLPKKPKLDSDTVAAIIKSLTNKKLIVEQAATRDTVKWRDGEDGGPIMLAITDAGLRAIKIEPAGEAKTASATNRKRPQRGPEKRAKSLSGKHRRAHEASGDAEAADVSRRGTKQAKLINLLRRAAGASIGEMVEATGWQAHSVRGVMSGALKKKLGLAIESETRANRGRVYRITNRG